MILEPPVAEEPPVAWSQNSLMPKNMQNDAQTTQNDAQSNQNAAQNC